MDVEWETGNIDVEKLEKKLKNSKNKPTAVMPVHFSGQPQNQ